MDAAIVLLEIILSAVWIYFGFFYGFWDKGKPGGGFIGVIFGSLILVIALGMGIRMLAKHDFGKKIKLHFAAFLPIIVGVITVGLSYLIGFIPAILFFMVGWLRFVSNYRWVKSLLIGVSFTIGIYMIFVMWLRVPFTTGVF